VYDAHKDNCLPLNPEYNSIISEYQVTVISPDRGSLWDPGRPSWKFFQKSYPVEDFTQPFPRRCAVVPGDECHAFLEIPFGGPGYGYFISRHAAGYPLSFPLPA